ncbi:MULTISPECIES: DUF1097 domain-containing protein [Photobacterium]|uniref:Membrane protein n=1 Tax=Photobacterium halotolerans TaxID=265726 RepID=A0A0F5VBW8_9GAMM|nr:MULTISPECIES: DUF1097 domain-containing protein [Photobacterium]KKC99660.1 membrane protein [Photobacterium halotolerans]UIP29962.1 DUF1097 domain-containing protein [Photobacterium sp. TLY01]
MSALIAIAITTGLLSGLWGWVAVSFGLLSWAGFLGCTTYFASPQEGLKGVGISMATNLSGVAWAMLIIHGSAWAGAELFGYIATGMVSFLMCVQAKRTWLSFIPGTFIGCCATFAAAGHWQLVIPSLMLGVVFGYAMKTSGLWLKAQTEKRAQKAALKSELTPAASAK